MSDDKFFDSTLDDMRSRVRAELLEFLEAGEKSRGKKCNEETLVDAMDFFCEQVAQLRVGMNFISKTGAFAEEGA
jgi:hypothetical protein